MVYQTGPSIFYQKDIIFELLYTIVLRINDKHI